MRILIAGGGTGGHLFPGLALAEEFKKKEENNLILFVGTKKGIEAFVVPQKGFGFKTIYLNGFRGKDLRRKLKSLFKLPSALFQSFLIIKNFRPHLVLGMGGYASAPLVVAAWLMRIKTAICEQNLIPGISNKILGRLVDRVFVSFEESLAYFPRVKTLVTGNPLQVKRVELREKRPKDKFTLVILGGSQGSHQINLAILSSLDYLSEIKDKLKIIHQSGKEDYPLLLNGYAQKDFDALIIPFIQDMVGVYQEADLIICRAGATTLSELMLWGRAAILVPFPLAVGNHQTINALSLVEKEAAQLILAKELTGERLAQAILQLYHRPEELKEMERKIGELAKPKATQEIIEHCYQLVGIE